MRSPLPFLLLAALAAHILPGCGRRPPSPPSPILIPLAVGNRWIWKTTTPIAEIFDTLAIVGDTVVESGHWFRTQHGEWMANFPDGLHMGDLFGAGFSTARLRVRYPVKVGDTMDVGVVRRVFSPTEYTTYAGIYTVVAELDEPVEVPAGEFSCIKTLYNPGAAARFGTFSSPISEGDCIYYAPGVGRVREVHYNANPSGRRTLEAETVLYSVTLR
jgi:hypothetical protein